MILITWYLVSVILSGCLIAIGSVAEDSKEDLLRMFSCICLILIWPISLIIWAYALFKEYLDQNFKDNALRIRNCSKLCDDKFDRSDIVVIPEKDLKILLKAYRKGFISLSNAQVEIIRDELMHRTAENHLLR